MSHDHQQNDHHHHGNQVPRKRPIHHDWRFWVAIVLTLAAMGVYVATMDDAILPGGKVGQEVPTAIGH